MSARFKVTITIKSEDLTNPPLESEGSETILISETVGADVRHLMEKSLAETIVGWGDLAMEARAAKKAPGK